MEVAWGQMGSQMVVSVSGRGLLGKNSRSPEEQYRSSMEPTVHEKYLYQIPMVSLSGEIRLLELPHP